MGPNLTPTALILLSSVCVSFGAEAPQLGSKVQTRPNISEYVSHALVRMGALTPEQLMALYHMLDDDGSGDLGVHEVVDVFDGVDNDALTLQDCAGNDFPHHWLGDGKQDIANTHYHPHDP